MQMPNNHRSFEGKHRRLIAVPVYNEEANLAPVLRKISDAAQRVGADLVVVDDGSTDGTPKLFEQFPEVTVLRHPRNRGYGAALRTAFRHSVENGYESLVTLDSDGQHDPSLLPQFFEEVEHWDIVSGSRYMQEFASDTPAPIERRRLNLLVTDQLNACFRLDLTDSFCGFKAYRVAALAHLDILEDGYGMPLELWVQAACQKMSVKEIAVPRIYLDPKRSFGATLDDSNVRLAYYQDVIDRAVARARRTVGCGLEGVKTPFFQRIDP